MKIAVIGAGGFVGSNLAAHLLHNHHVTPITRATVDMLDPMAVLAYLQKQRFDVIINAAAVMTNNDMLHDTRNNLGLFMNLHSYSHLFGKLINLGSGAEFDRTRNINNMAEYNIHQCMPQDSYGFGQNIKSRLCSTKFNFYTLRLFNCFGKGEYSSRIIPRFVAQQSEDVFEIQNDRLFDYFSIQDLCKVVDSFVDNNHKLKDVNCVYSNKFKISEMIATYCSLHNLKPNYKVVSISDNNYTGSSANLDSLNINLDGLEKGLEAYAYN